MRPACHSRGEGRLGDHTRWRRAARPQRCRTLRAVPFDEELAEQEAAYRQLESDQVLARKAIEKFPDSEKCALTYQYVRKNQFQSEIQDLNRAVRTKPTAGHYERLAHIYLNELADRSRALEVAQEGLLKFPSSDALHCVCAQVRMERFHSDFLANDTTEAIRHANLALAAATAREALIDLAAARLRVARAELTTADGFVSVRADRSRRHPGFRRRAGTDGPALSLGEPVLAAGCECLYRPRHAVYRPRGIQPHVQGPPPPACALPG